MKKILVALVLVTVMIFAVVGCNDNPAKEYYTVTFDVDGGSAVNAQTVESGEKATAPADPTKEGYTFAGWFVGETAYDFASAVTADVTVKAKWTQNTYSVTFDADGGSAVDAQTVAHGASATKPADPTKEGYTFAGWFVGETAYDFASTVTADVTVKAKWTQNTYSVTFDADGGSAVDAQTVVHGASATKPGDPTKEGYTFAGWFVGETAYDFASAVTADVTVKAKWTQNTYSVTFDADGGSAVDAQTVLHGEKAKAPVVPTKPGFAFVAWYIGEIAYDFATPVTGEVALKAKWEVDLPDLTAIAGTYTGKEQIMTMTNFYTFDIKADGNITASYETSSATIEMTVNYVIFKDGKLTVNYTAGSTTNNIVFSCSEAGVLVTDASVTGNQLTLYKNYTVIFDFNYDDTDPKTLVVEHGNTVKSQSKSRTGYTLDGWLVGENLFDFDTPITSDMTLVAKWSVKKYTVTFYNQDGEIAKEIEVDYGHVLTVDEIPTTGIITKDGYKLNGKWYTSATATSPQDLSKTITANKKYYPGVIAPMTEIAGTWNGTDSKGQAYTLTVEALTQSVNATIVKDGVTDELDITVIYFKEFAGISSTATKLVIRYIADGSTSETTLTLTYADGKLTGSNSLTLEKEGVKEYTVTFDANGGSAVESQTVTQDSTATEPAEPTMDGFSFDGWYLGETKYDFATPVTGDITLTAKWIEKAPAAVDYTVTFELDGGKLTGVELVQTVAQGALAVAPEKNPTKSNYTFVGWYLGETEYDFTAPVTGDITLVAKWKGVSKTVKIYKQDGTLYKEFGGEYGKTIEEVLKENLTADEYNNLVANLCTVQGSYFTGMWFTSGNGTTEVKFTDVLTANRNIYANFISTVAKDFEGTWTCTTSSDKTYKFTFDVITDAEGNITGVKIDEASVNGTAYEVVFVRTYFKDGTLPQIIIRYQKTATTMGSFTIKLVDVDGVYVWQIDNTTLVKQ